MCCSQDSARRAKPRIGSDARDVRDPAFSVHPDILFPGVMPRVLLVSEAPALPDAQGASQTLRALFRNYPGPLRIVTLASAATEADELDRVTVTDRIIPRRINRLGPRAAKLRARLDFAIITWLGPVRRIATGFRPDVIIVCPLGTWGVAIGAAAARFTGAPLITYFMDDWPGASDPFPGVARILQQADGWLVISERLRDAFVARYRPSAPPTLVVHNPARPSATLPRVVPTTSTRPFRVVYAGSIWPMHLDALAATANAIAGLREQGVAAQLVLHTPPSFWNAHESMWHDLGVENGGLLPHSLLQVHLRDADLLLVAASFLPEQAPMSQSSVQTKLTDYLAAGTPILGVGPPGAASLDLVDRWGVGLTCASADPTSIAATLRNWIEHPPDRNTLANRAHEVLTLHFDPNIVCPRLWHFIADIAALARRPASQQALGVMPPDAVA